MSIQIANKDTSRQSFVFCIVIVAVIQKKYARVLQNTVEDVITLCQMCVSHVMFPSQHFTHHLRTQDLSTIWLAPISLHIMLCGKLLMSQSESEWLNIFIQGDRNKS